MGEKFAEGVLEGPFLHYVYNLLRANVLRERKTMSLILIQKGEVNQSSFIQHIQEILREKDVLFLTENPNEIGLLLPQSGSQEALGFLSRLREICVLSNTGSEGETFQTSIIEVFHPELSLDLAISLCRKSMEDTPLVNENNVFFAEAGFERPVIAVKVSILEGDRLFREILSMAMERILVPGIELQVRQFEDGLTLFQSEWANSWHPHLVVMNDVLPKKNGLDVLHELRAMPNEEKFTILMMTRRNSEEDMIYAYESGTDEYLVKPFNLRLFEAQVKRMLAGLWT